MANFTIEKKIAANGNTEDLFIQNEIGSSDSSTAPELSTFDSGFYLWKKGTYIKVYNRTYTNPSTAGADVPIFLTVYDNNVYMVGKFRFSDDTVTNSQLNMHSFYTTGVSSERVNIGKLNGSSSISDWYAPTSAGTSGQFLKSTGGTPNWETVNIPTSYVSSLNGDTGAITNVAKTNVNNNFSVAQSGTSFTLSNGTPLNLTGYGTGTYNRAAFVCNTTDKFGVECPRETDSASGTIVPFRIGVRGGQLGNLHTGTVKIGDAVTLSYDSTNKCLKVTF